MQTIQVHNPVYNHYQIYLITTYYYVPIPKQFSNYYEPKNRGVMKKFRLGRADGAREF